MGTKKAGEDWRPIEEKLCAALLQSFRGQHGKNGLREVPGVTGTLGKANSHFNPIHTGLGPHHHVEAAFDWCRICAVAAIVCNSCGRYYRKCKKGCC